MEIVLAVLCGPLLWLAGAIAFDVVHFLFHVMLRSNNSLLRTLARPHQVHHDWIDRNLTTNWPLQRQNVWCHLIPEYATQLLFTAAVALVLPLSFVIVVFVLQTLVFSYVISRKGRDLNHRPEPRLDAHPPGPMTPSSYHLLHHVWPNAYYGAYTKLVDFVLGTATQIADRTFGWMGRCDRHFDLALMDEVTKHGGVHATAAGLSALDVLVVLDPDAPLEAIAEMLIEATTMRQLPPELWVVRKCEEDGVARHYYRDPRIVCRTLVMSSPPTTPEEARRAAKRTLFWARRDAQVMTPRLATFAGGAMLRRRFRSTGPVAPAGERVRHRMELTPLSG